AQPTRKKIRVNETMGINTDFKVILFKNDTSSRFTIRTGPVTAWLIYPCLQNISMKLQFSTFLLDAGATQIP
ncbi:MAG: hypothetical protein QGH62_06140, partial [Nitrospinaceae bacterium]|nr:hypothetical protein [Nitrospinaceae bacterium]